jgi:hypothetical protein
MLASLMPERTRSLVSTKQPVYDHPLFTLEPPVGVAPFAVTVVQTTVVSEIYEVMMVVAPVLLGDGDGVVPASGELPPDPPVLTIGTTDEPVFWLTALAVVVGFSAALVVGVAAGLVAGTDAGVEAGVEALGLDAAGAGAALTPH